MHTANWPEIIEEIRSFGNSYNAMSFKTGIPKPTIYGIAKIDAEPAWPDGEAILSLWVDTTGRDRNQIPLRKYSRMSRLFRKANARS